jgi:hypothetical protein
MKGNLYRTVHLGTCHSKRGTVTDKINNGINMKINLMLIAVKDKW